MHALRCFGVPILGTLAFVLGLLPTLTFPAGDPPPQANAPTVDQVQAAATWYARERWPKCRPLDITPYLALDGSVNAWAAQFSIDGTNRWNTETLLDEADRRGVAYEQARAAVPSAVTADASPAPREARLTARRARAEAARIASFDGEIGTVLLAARTDMYPLLERFEGAAPHVVAREGVRRQAGLPSASAQPIARTFYLGPMAVFHEAAGRKTLSNGMPAELLDPVNAKAYPMAGQLLKSGNGRLKATTGRKSSIPSEEYWSTLAKQGHPPAQLDLDDAYPVAYDIDGVPYYHQDDYAPLSCGAVGPSQIFGYWDDNGYGNLIDNGSSTTGMEEEAIYNLMGAVHYHPDRGTPFDDEAEGIGEVISHSAYGNCLDFYIGDQNGEEEPLHWNTDIVPELAADLPFVYGNMDTGRYPEWAHFTAAMGYDGKDATLRLHYNYLQGGVDTPYDLAWLNVDSDNERMYRVHPHSAPFSTVLDDNFEQGTSYGQWQRESYGSTWAVWNVTTAEVPVRTRDPQPPGGDPSWAAYCVGNSADEAGNYPPNVDTWMIYGPFSTLDATGGEFMVTMGMRTSDPAGDIVSLLVSTDGTTWSGPGWGKQPYDVYFKASVDLGSVPDLGSVLNRPQVWVAVSFRSDADPLVGQGATIDNATVLLRPEGMTRLAVPTGAAASQGAYGDRVRVTWNAVPGATHYRLLRKDGTNGEFKPHSLWVQGTSYDDRKNVVEGQSYFYQVVAAASPSGFRAGIPAPQVEGWLAVDPPNLVAASDGTSRDKVVVTWEQTGKFYQVMRSTQFETGFAAVSDWIEDAFFEDTTADPGTDYFYRVARSLKADGSQASAMSAANAGWRLVRPPSPITASDGASAPGVYVNWSLDGTGQYFQVYRGTHPEGVPEPISGWIHQAYFLDTTGTPFATYYYRVKAAGDDTGTHASAFTAYNTGWRHLGDQLGVQASDGTDSARIAVQWASVPGATHYWVWRSSEESGSRTCVAGPTTGTAWNDTNTRPGDTYWYWVVSGVDASGSRVSGFGASDEGWRAVPAPGGVSATQGTWPNGVRVSWTGVPGADGYSVRRATSPTPPAWDVICPFTEDAEFVDRPPTTCSPYYYSVLAGGASGTRWSPASAAAQGWMALETPAHLTATDGGYSGGIQQRWAAVPGATHYRVHRAGTATPQAEERQPITGWITGTRCTDSDPTLLEETLYYYWVEAARSAEGDCASPLAQTDSGWRARVGPANFQASDGTMTDRVVLTWDPAPGAPHYRVYRLDGSGTTTALGSWSMGNRYDDLSAAPGEKCTYWVRASAHEDGSYPSVASIQDQGWIRSTEFSQQPNMTDGYGVVSWRGGATSHAVYDDWECTDGATITGLQWWGSFQGWGKNQATQLAPPSSGTTGFRVRKFSHQAGVPPTPGSLLASIDVSLWDTEWVGVIPHAMPQGNTEYEHVYRFAAGLPSALDEEAGAWYFLCIQALHTSSSPAYPWQWLGTEQHHGAPAFHQLDSGTLQALSWPPGHRLEGQSFDTAFELFPEESAPTPTPTPTPTATPPPDAAWYAPPNMVDGYDTTSWMETGNTAMSRAFDDIETSSTLTARRLRWHGSYPGYEQANPGTVDPPLDRPESFRIAWYTAVAGAGGLEPGTLISSESCTTYAETGGEAMPLYYSPTNAWEHEFHYEAALVSPWVLETGTRYFVSIQAQFASPPAWGWGWLNAGGSFGSTTLLLYDDTPPPSYSPTWWAPGHRLAGEGMDMSLELLSSTPTPIPSRTPTPSPTPSSTPSSTPSPTPTPTPTATIVAWNMRRNLRDGIPHPAYRVGSRAAPARIADDWESNGTPINKIVFWGAYSNWNEDSPGPVPPPALRPDRFDILRFDYTEPAMQPGTLLATEPCPSYSEQYLESIPLWSDPQRWVHIFEYTCEWPAAWTPVEGEINFLAIQAVYAATPQTPWGWLSADGHWNAAAMTDESGPWTALAYPPGHRLAGTPVDMAFELWTAPSPPPTATATPTPSPSPTATPIPVERVAGQAPDLVSGFDSACGRTTNDTSDTLLAEDFLLVTAETIHAIRWWGSYPGWQAGTPSPVDPPGWLDPASPPNSPWPADRPVAFAISCRSTTASPFPQPDALLFESSVRAYGERWVAAMPQWDNPAVFEHEFLYEARLDIPWSLEPGTYHLTIQPIYSAPPTHAWGWLDSREPHGGAATKRVGTGAWTELTPPPGHPLQGQPLALAFEVLNEAPVTPVPTPSPTPTPSATPTPTPPDWYTLTITTANGGVGRNATQDSYAPGTTVLLNGRPDAGYLFDQWTGDVPPGHERDNPLAVTMDGNRNLEATFRPAISNWVVH